MQKRETAINHTPVSSIGVKHPHGYYFVHPTHFGIVQNFRVMQVTEVRKSQSFSDEKPFAVVRFRKSVKGSKFATGSLNDGSSYSLTYNLALIYPDIKNDEGEFDSKEAYKLFKSEMAVGMEEPVNGYDVPISEISDLKAVIIKATKRRMEVMRPACYGTRDDAIRIAKASLERQLKEKTFIPADEEEED